MIRIRSLAAVATCAIAFLTTTPVQAKRHHHSPYNYQQQQAIAYQQFYQRQAAYYHQHTIQWGQEQEPARRVYRAKKKSRVAKKTLRKTPLDVAIHKVPDANGNEAMASVTTELSPRRTVPDIIAGGEETERRSIDANLKMPSVLRPSPDEEEEKGDGGPGPNPDDDDETTPTASIFKSYKTYVFQQLSTGDCKANTIKVMTAFDIPICVDPRFAQKFAFFFALLKEKGCQIKEIVCQSWGHMRGSNHHGGGACDVDQYRRDKTHASCMYNSGDLVKQAGLYDGCWWGNRDCGHVEAVQGLFNYGRTHYAGRSKHRTRYASRHHTRYASRHHTRHVRMAHR